MVPFWKSVSPGGNSVAMQSFTDSQENTVPLSIYVLCRIKESEVSILAHALPFLLKCAKIICI